MSEGLQVRAQGAQEIVMSRSFAAASSQVFEALTTPDLLRRWLLGPPGWEMTVCDLDPRAGGSYRYVWRQISDGTEMGVGGVFREFSPQRMVHTERFDQPWYPGEAVVTTVLSEGGGSTAVTTTMRYESPQARDAVLNSPMKGGVAQSYDRLEQLLRRHAA